MTDALTSLATALADRYRLDRKLGEGGMATVYLADDLKHQRKVALKVLRPELAAILGAERFLAEIRTTANLQHPHILALHDSGQVDGTVFYVMPFVDGESLRDRLTRETQLPVEAALRIAQEVADALGYAHGKGIIHRDIKPENILLQGGHALVADFGIALAVSRSDGASRMTETGMSLGTPHYMSPEQAMGERTLDQRTDIYALAAMTYEMLAGEPPFTGPSAQAIIAKVMTSEPASLMAQRKTVPPHVEAAVLVALSKLPADRFASVADFAAALADPGRSLPTLVRPAARAGSADPWRQRALGLGLAALVATGAAAWGWLRPAPLPPASSQHITLYLKGNRPATLLRSARLSPDGESIVFPDSAAGTLQLWRKDRDQAEAEAIPGTTGASSVTAFSPDGEWIAFTSGDGVLRKVPSRGGTAMEVAKGLAPAAWTGAWLADGTILFNDKFQLLAVADTGGPVRTIIDKDAGVVAITPLPDGKSALVTRCTAFCVSSVDVWLVNLADGAMRLLLPETSRAWPLPDGRLLYVRRNGSVHVARWDRERGTVATAGEPLLEGVLTGFRGLPFLSLSQSGSLLYMPGTEEIVGRRQLFWVDRAGRAAPVDSSWRVIFAPSRFQSLALTPAGDRVAVILQSDTGGNTLWVKALDRGPATRLIATTPGLGSPSWSSDGRRLAYVISDSSGGALWTRTADGSDEPSLVLRLPGARLNAVRWAPDGRSFVGAAVDTSNGGWIWSFRPGTDTVPVRVPESGSQPNGPSISPDGHWLAYSARQGDVPEVYVRPYPNTRDGRWQVSNGGGAEALWAQDSRALYYREVKPPQSRSEDSKLTMATLRFAPSFAVVSREELFSDAYGRSQVAPNYAVSADGRRFLMMESTALPALKSLDLVLLEHWVQGIPQEGAR